MTSLDLLRDTRLFSGCTEQDLFRLCELAQERSFADGDFLFSQGQEAQELIVMASGKVQLELSVSVLGQSSNIAFETKVRGEVVGWSALVPPHRYTLSGRASGGVSVVAFLRSDLIPLFESDLGLGFRVMKNLVSIVGLRLHLTQAMWTREIQRSLDERYR